MATSEELQTMLLRMTALEEKEQASQEHIKVIEALLSKSKEVRRTSMSNRKSFSTVPCDTGTIEERENWNFKMVTFLNAEEDVPRNPWLG